MAIRMELRKQHWKDGGILRESPADTLQKVNTYRNRQAIRKVTALLSVEEELADVNAAERVVAIKENERRAITAKLSSEADGTSPLRQDWMLTEKH